MSVCSRCHRRFELDEGRCPACQAPLLEVVGSADPVGSEPADDSEEQGRFVLLLEEPLYEMAAMIQEFLQNCGIGVFLRSEPIGLLYRPVPGADISSTRVYVHESDFPEARELVAHFFARI